jgi:NADPH:quinone reductase-like Zn-dependent oxidoreductase
MKAYAYTEQIGVDHLRLVERPDPVPGAHQVVLRMRAAALNYRDLAIARGGYHIAVEPPLIPVSDGAGEVIRMGSNVTRFRLGDLACPVYLPNWIDGPVNPRAVKRRLGGPNDGVLAELVCLNEEDVVRAPSHLDATEAATLPVAAVTAWHSLYQLGSLRPGETLVVLGTGGVSTAALQLARAGGARVIAVTRREKHAARLRQFGASDVVVSSATTEWPASVVELTQRRGADVVLDVVGGSSLADSIAATRQGGLVHLVGYAADTAATFDIFDAIRHGVTIRIASAGSRESFEALVRVMEQQLIKPAVDRIFPVAQFRDAFTYLSEGGHFGKVVLSFQ